MTTFFIDYEGFQCGLSSPIMKELTIICVESPQNPLYFNFTSPCVWEALSEEQRRTYHYQTTRLHRIQWYEGYTRYCKECLWYHFNMAFPQWMFGIFYVMDRRNGLKINSLRREFPQLNIVPYTSATFRTLPDLTDHHKCPYRDHGKHCSYIKCLKL